MNSNYSQLPQAENQQYPQQPQPSFPTGASGSSAQSTQNYMGSMSGAANATNTSMAMNYPPYNAQQYPVPQNPAQGQLPQQPQQVGLQNQAGLQVPNMLAPQMSTQMANGTQQQLYQMLQQQQQAAQPNAQVADNATSTPMLAQMGAMQQLPQAQHQLPQQQQVPGQMQLSGQAGGMAPNPLAALLGNPGLMQQFQLQQQLQSVQLLASLAQQQQQQQAGAAATSQGMAQMGQQPGQPDVSALLQQLQQSFAAQGQMALPQQQGQGLMQMPPQPPQGLQPPYGMGNDGTLAAPMTQAMQVPGQMEPVSGYTDTAPASAPAAGVPQRDRYAEPAGSYGRSRDRARGRGESGARRRSRSRSPSRRHGWHQDGGATQRRSRWEGSEPPSDRRGGSRWTSGSSRRSADAPPARAPSPRFGSDPSFYQGGNYEPHYDTYPQHDRYPPATSDGPHAPPVFSISKITQHFRACAHWDGYDGSCKFGHKCKEATSHIPGKATAAFQAARECVFWDGREDSCSRGARCRYADSHRPGHSTLAHRVVFDVKEVYDPARPLVNDVLNELVNSGTIPPGQSLNSKCLDILHQFGDDVVAAAVRVVMRPHKQGMRDVNGVLIAECRQQNKKLHGTSRY